MLKFPLLVATLVLVFSCGTNDEHPASNTNNTMIDTLAVLNDPKNNLNVQTNSFSEIDSSGILMFPLSMGESKRESGGSYYKNIPYSSYWNIVFYNSNTSSYHLLSEKKMLISSFDIRYNSDGSRNMQVNERNIFYKVRVDDYNQDQKLTDDDPEYLFVSDKEGKNFRQVSPSGFHLQNWAFISASNKLVMTVTKDSDKNKVFGDKDEVASFQIDIDKETNATEIFSQDFKKKLKLMFDRDWKRLND